MAPRKQTKLNQDELWNYALRLLAKKAYSAAQIRQKLNQRATETSLVPTILTKLKEYGFADDEKFSELYAQSRLRNQGFGRSRVLRDLRAKRVSSKIAEQAIEKTFAGTSEAELIDNFLARKYRSKDLASYLQEEKNVASAYRKLRLAGFTSSASLVALKRHAKRAADWEISDESSAEPI